MKPTGYEQFTVDCNLSECSLEDAVLSLGPAFVYNLTISPNDVIEAKNLLRRLQAQFVYNPLAPYVNIIIDSTYKNYEWSLSANGKGIWSSGV